jgi:hypothetical protein
MALSEVRAVQTSEPVKTYSLYIDGKWSGAADGGRYSMEEMTELKWITVQLGQRQFPF